jgi:hypothetical protein
MKIPKEPPQFDLIAHTRTRLAIGDRVGRSRREIPTFDLFAQVDVTALSGYRQQLKERGDADIPTYNDLFVYTIARLLPEFPVLNAWYEPEGLKVFKEVHLGVVVHTHEGVLLPTLFDADQKGLGQISQDARELTELPAADGHPHHWVDRAAAHRGRGGGHRAPHGVARAHGRPPHRGRRRGRPIPVRAERTD